MPGFGPGTPFLFAPSAPEGVDGSLPDPLGAGVPEGSEGGADASSSTTGFGIVAAGVSDEDDAFDFVGGEGFTSCGNLDNTEGESLRLTIKGALVVEGAMSVKRCRV